MPEPARQHCEGELSRAPVQKNSRRKNSKRRISKRKNRIRENSIRKISQAAYIITAGTMALLHMAARSSREFGDWYITHIFPIWVNTYGRFTGLFPFSVGEFMGMLGILLAAGGVLLGLIRLSLAALSLPGRMAWQENARSGTRLDKCRHFCRGFCHGYCRILAWTALGAYVLMNLNCFMLYNGFTFSEKYFGADAGDYTLEELAALRNFVVEQCNDLSCRIPRNGDGSISYEGDMGGAAKSAMRHLGATYGNLRGFYPNPKPAAASDFMSQQYVSGCFTPFSMEANYNNVMYVMNKPATLCHELAHLKGFIREDEANFIGYLACIQSDDIIFRYSGYLSVLYYIDNDFYDAVGRDRDRYLDGTAILPQVHEDNIFLTREEWARIERRALFDTEAVEAASDRVTDANLKLNGVSEGMASYSRVVALLLQYYELYGYEY